MPVIGHLMKFLSWRPRPFLTRADRIPIHRIHLLPAGLELVDLRTRKSLWHIDWADVKEIITFKIDAYVIDHICIGFRTRDEYDYEVACEEHENWNTLCDHLQTQFGIDWAKCWLHVLFPAFAANRTTIWGEPWPPPCPRCRYDLRHWPKICPECGRPVDPPALLPSSTA